jgi:hypothetical protein
MGEFESEQVLGSKAGTWTRTFRSQDRELYQNKVRVEEMGDGGANA